ncbi:3'-5' exonuclease [Marinobacterium sp. MBR-109]|uniref:3'-5' exonuclease n=1 Tax=Marinobacterium sp. MBR-109 TaxID=3156462 RepID=UPI0033971AD0
MNTILFYDTETTGLPDWKAPSESETQPHLVQLAAILANADTRQVISALDLIIQPNGWEIPDEVSEIHGITTDMANKVGVNEADALAVFMKMTGGKRVAHNKTFDQRIIRIGLKRYGYSDHSIDQWAEKDNHDCTMLMAKPIMQMGPKGRYGYKSPKLSEAYLHFTGKELQNAHSAMADAQACMEIYWAMQDLAQQAA